MVEPPGVLEAAFEVGRDRNGVAAVDGEVEALNVGVILAQQAPDERDGGAPVAPALIAVADQVTPQAARAFPVGVPVDPLPVEVELEEPNALPAGADRVRFDGFVSAAIREHLRHGETYARCSSATSSWTAASRLRPSTLSSETRAFSTIGCLPVVPDQTQHLGEQHLRGAEALVRVDGPLVAGPIAEVAAGLAQDGRERGAVPGV